MAKNYASLYAGGNDSIAIEQKFYVKAEVTRGTLVAPAATDFLYTLQGGTITHAKPFITSPHRSGRHHTDIIKEKTTTEWSIPMYINIDTAVAAGATEVDSAVQVLMESVLGKKTVSSGVIFDSSETPDTTFSIFQCGDVWSEQVPGAFAQGLEISLPGDGQAQMTFSGAAKTRYLVGIGKSLVDNDTTNTITLQTGEGKRFPVGSKVMIIEANGTTRSADTTTARTVTGVVGDVVTVDGAVLADADGSGLNAPIYLVYWEPTTSTGINDPQTGLVGSVSIDNLPSLSCLRNATISLANDHELVNYCYGTDSLSGPLFIPGSRLSVTLSMEMNLNQNVAEYLNLLTEFVGNDITFIVGDAADRHLKIELPKVKFPVPAISVPENGSIPVTFDGGMALQTALDVADEITISYL